MALKIVLFFAYRVGLKNCLIFDYTVSKKLIVTAVLKNPQRKISKCPVAQSARPSSEL